MLGGRGKAKLCVTYCALDMIGSLPGAAVSAGRRTQILGTQKPIWSGGRTEAPINLCACVCVYI